MTILIGILFFLVGMFIGVIIGHNLGVADTRKELKNKCRCNKPYYIYNKGTRDK